MARRAAKVDRNQAEIVTALRAVGASVTPTHAAGAGFPDLTVGYDQKTYLLEIKDGALPPSARELTPQQVKWHSEWRGHAAVVTNIDEAFAAIGIRGDGPLSKNGAAPQRDPKTQGVSK